MIVIIRFNVFLVYFNLEWDGIVLMYKMSVFLYNNRLKVVFKFKVNVLIFL